MRLYNGYKKHYQYKTLVDLLFLLLIFVILTFIIKNYFKPFMNILVLIVISTPVYDIIKKIINKKQAAGLVFYLPAACLHVSYSAVSSFLIKLL